MATITQVPETKTETTTETKTEAVPDTAKHLVEVDNVAFADAIARSNINPWSKRMFQLYFFFA
jgi:hypothetical protein